MSANTVRLTSHLNQVLTQLDAGYERNVENATITLFRGVQKKLTGQRTGRLYYVPGTRRSYTASAPGEAPARRTGRLANSYRYIFHGTRGFVGTPLLYGLYLERGTGRMAPRPALSPALQENQDAIQADLGRPIE